MIRYILYLLLVVLLSCNRTPDRSVKEFEYYTFINDIIKFEGQQFLVEDPDTFTMNITQLNRRILSLPYVASGKENKDFIFLQYDNVKTFKWRGDSLKNTLVINWQTVHKYKKEGWPKIEYDRFEPGYYQFGIPLFNLDRTRCIFSYSYHCGGECGHGNTSLYQWTGSKWVKIFDFGGWVS